MIGRFRHTWFGERAGWGSVWRRLRKSGIPPKTSQDGEGAHSVVPEAVHKVREEVTRKLNFIHYKQ
jgi:hypothetical protein